MLTTSQAGCVLKWLKWEEKKRKKVLSKVKHASDAKLAFGREVTHGDWGLRAALLWSIQNLFLACDSPENGRWAHLDLSKNWGCHRRRLTSLLCSLKWRGWQLCGARKREDSTSRGGLKGRRPHLQHILSLWEAQRWTSGGSHFTQSRTLHGRVTCQLFRGPDTFFIIIYCRISFLSHFPYALVTHRPPTGVQKSHLQARHKGPSDFEKNFWEWGSPP